MSFPENDRKVQSRFGKTFPDRAANAQPQFALAIAAALKAEYGGAGAAVKVVARLTAANERAVRNWFEGKNAPNGENMITLICHSDAVLEAVLTLSGRSELLIAGRLSVLRDQLKHIVRAIESLSPD